MLLPQDLLGTLCVRADSTEKLQVHDAAAEDGAEASQPPSPQLSQAAQPFTYRPLEVSDLASSSSPALALAASRASPVAFARTTAMHTETVSSRDDVVSKERSALARDSEELAVALANFEALSQVCASQWTAMEAQLRSLE